MLPDYSVVDLDANSNTIVYSVVADIALLKIPKSGEKKGLLLSDLSDVEIGDSVAIFGWTKGFDEQNCTIAHIKEIGFDSTDEYVYTPVDAILCDAVTLSSGNSGGPWITVDNKCIGLTSYGYTKRLTISSTDIRNSYNNGTSINIDTETLDFSQSFNTLAVSSRSVSKLVSKYINFIATNVNMINLVGPYNYYGKTLKDFYIKPLTLKMIQNYLFMNEMKGYILINKVSFNSPTYVVCKIDNEIIGTLNGQTNAGLLIFYAENDLNAVYTTDGNNETNVTLEIQDRGVNSALFTYLKQKSIIKNE
jgi:hypothetical protein